MNGHNLSDEESPRLFARRPPGLDTAASPEDTPGASSLPEEQSSGRAPKSWTQRLAQVGFLVGGTVLLHLLLDRSETTEIPSGSKRHQFGVDSTQPLSRRSQRGP